MFVHVGVQEKQKTDGIPVQTAVSLCVVPQLYLTVACVLCIFMFCNEEEKKSYILLVRTNRNAWREWNYSSHTTAIVGFEPQSSDNKSPILFLRTRITFNIVIEQKGSLLASIGFFLLLLSFLLLFLLTATIYPDLLIFEDKDKLSAQHYFQKETGI